jgi:hypothetical protein
MSISVVLLADGEPLGPYVLLGALGVLAVAARYGLSRRWGQPLRPVERVDASLTQSTVVVFVVWFALLVVAGALIDVLSSAVLGAVIVIAGTAALVWWLLRRR